MIVLGLHFGHDGTACLVKDGRLVGALSTERVTRHKKESGVTREFMDYFFGSYGITPYEIDVVAVSDWNPQYARGQLDLYDKEGHSIECSWNRIFDNEIVEYDGEFKGKRLPAYNVGHHLCHAASSYYTSPFQDAVCFTMDSSGGELKSNSLIAKGEGNKLTALNCPGLQAGLAYGAMCERIGLGSQVHKAGSMMGLAAYGKVNERVKGAANWYAGRCFHALHTGIEYWKWVDWLWNDLSGAGGFFTSDKSDKQQAMDIAATMQFIFEEAILKGLAEAPDSSNLCLAGGSFLNCNVNSRIVRESKFPNVHLFPACGDDGGALGAALYVAHHILNDPRPLYHDRHLCYLGPDRPSTPPDLPTVAQAIADGKIVGWFQGRSEFGPRALGNRSILADPRNPGHRDKLNFQIKKREWFRPFAPSVLAQYCSEWFDWDRPSPFMLMTAQVKRSEVPAITHVDGSARMQTVERDLNPVYYDLIAEFHTITGVPMVLNTSLNGPGEPIIETEEDALRFWKNVPVDMMVINGRIYTR